MASGYWFNAGGESSAQANVTEDGNVVVTTGHPDIGGSRAAIANLTGGSRVLFASAMVVTESAAKVVDQLKQRAAKIWGIAADQVVWENGEARPIGEHSGNFPSLSFGEMAAKANTTGGPIGSGFQSNTIGAEGGFATHVVDVEVEVEVDVGIVTVLRYTSFQAVGRAIHPAYVEGKMQGGAAQGIGWALNEEYIYNRRARWKTWASSTTVCWCARTCRCRTR